MDMNPEEIEMKWYPSGWDFGNSESDFVTTYKGEIKKISTPTALTRVDLFAMQNLGDTFINDKEKNKSDEDNKLIIQMDGENVAYAFGDYALSQSTKTWNGREDENRYASRYSLRALLLSAATLITDREFGLYVVCGIPASLYTQRDEKFRETIKQQLTGTFTFSIDGKTKRKVTVVAAAIVMEGAGALLGRPGLTRTTESGVIDIGGGTTDLYGQLGASPVTKYCRGTDQAVEAATTIVRKIFATKWKRDLTDKEAREIMHAYAGTGKRKFYPPISAYGTAIKGEDLHAIVTEAVGLIAEDILTFINQIWKDGIARFSNILLIGGGAYYFYDVLKLKITHLQKHEDPIFANAIGYQSLASRKLPGYLQELKQQEAEKVAKQQEAAAAAGED